MRDGVYKEELLDTWGSTFFIKCAEKALIIAKKRRHHVRTIDDIPVDLVLAVALKEFHDIVFEKQIDGETSNDKY